MNAAEKIYEHVKVLPESAAREVLNFVEFIEMKQRNSGAISTTAKVERLRLLRNACGVWKARFDLPDFSAIRRDFDRGQGDEP